MMQYFRRRSPNPDSGFTLIEVLVVVIIISVLSAIAAPGWLAFVNNRRISTVRSQAADAIRKAQTEAKTTQTMRAVVLDMDDKTNSPRLAIVRCITAPASTLSASSQCDFPTTLNWQTLGGGDVKTGVINYTKVTKDQTGSSTYIGSNANYKRLVFDGNGVVKRSLSDVPAVTAIPSAAPLFTVGFELRVPNGKENPRCLLVQTLLGGLREGNGKAECGG
jgi:prepilin-type N-terminal cleavage/methylation domain-containing protein